MEVARERVRGVPAAARRAGGAAASRAAGCAAPGAGCPCTSSTRGPPPARAAPCSACRRARTAAGRGAGSSPLQRRLHLHLHLHLRRSLARSGAAGWWLLLLRGKCCCSVAQAQLVGGWWYNVSQRSQGLPAELHSATHGLRGHALITASPLRQASTSGALDCMSHDRFLAAPRSRR